VGEGVSAVCSIDYRKVHKAFMVSSQHFEEVMNCTKNTTAHNCNATLPPAESSDVSSTDLTLLRIWHLHTPAHTPVYSI